MMKKFFWATVTMAVLQLAGVLSIVRDYGTVGVNYAADWFKKSMPVNVDIERLELSLQQLDSEIASNGRKVVEQSVALDRYAAQVSSKESSLAQTRNDLKALRNKFVSLDDDAAKKPIEDEMAKRLARHKVQSQTLQSTKTALANQRQAYESMLAAFEKQKLDRDILKEKLESFRAEYETMQMRGDLQQSTIIHSASRKASDLAIEIADRLEIQRRLAAVATNCPSQDFADGSESVVFELSAVDEVIGFEDAGASKQVVAR
ncbi:MAG: hypothetical protein IT423_12630 [Pirellulaceae bacterium]|nr:hypothetical protein [Pirellulaceae bacterium]